MKRLLLLLLLLSRFAEATTYYVGKTGSDANSCTTAQTEGTPKLTIAGGLSCVSISAGAGAGHTVQVAVGTYAEGLYNTFRSGTSFASPFTLKAKPGDEVIIRPTASGGQGAINFNGGQWWIIEGFIIDGDLTTETVVTIETSNVRFLNCEVRDVQINNGYILGTVATNAQIVGGSVHDGPFAASGGNGKGYGVYVAGSGHLIDGVEVYNIEGYGIHVYDSVFQPSNNVIKNCIIRDANQDPTLGHEAGIILARGTNNQAINNVIRNNGGHGINIGFSASNTRVFHNTIYANNQSCLNILSNSGTGHQFINNICFSNATGPIINACGAGCVTISSNTTTDPSFAGAPTNLRLTAGSNSIDNAIATTPSVTTDLLGVSRPQGLANDRGAYEFDTASINVLVPNGGESWPTGSSQTVTWGSVGSVGATVDINEDQDGNGTYETVIANDTANDGSLGITVSGSANANRKMQICDSDGSPCDVSDAVYAVTAAGGGTITKIISDNSTGSFIGDINGVDDAEIWQVQPTLNQASATSMFSSKVSSSNHSYLLLKFPTGGIPSNAVVTSVTLGLRLDSSNCSDATAETFDVRRLLRTWVESEATWNLFSTGNSWTTAGGLGAATDRTSTAVAQITGVTCTGQYYTVTQTSGGLFDLVQNWIDGDNTNQGLHIERNGTGNDGAYRGFISSEGTNGQRPYLSVTYTTSAGTITLTQPTTGGHFFPGQTVPIRWQSAGLSGNLSVLASRDGGATYGETVNAAYRFDGPDLAWTIPAGPAASNCLIKACSIDDPTVCGVSVPFRIGGTSVRFK